MISPHLSPNESLTVEFKSDLKPLQDRELVEAVVCLANADGGQLWLGVEDNAIPTGLHPEHLQLTGLAGMVAARTSPSLWLASRCPECTAKWPPPAAYICVGD